MIHILFFSSAINFEHAWTDGVSVLRFFNEVLEDSYNHFVGPSTREDKSCNPHEEVKHLDFVFDNEIKQAAEEAHRQWKQTTSNLDLNYVKFSEVSRNFFKKNKLSPDAMFQLAFQLAYYRLFNKTTATYESCSTAAFKHGRTETIRPCTNQTKMFCEGLLTKSKQLPKEDLRKLLDECSKTHYELCKQASMGQGFDRHLFAMKNIYVKENGEHAPLPELYTDESYIFANTYELSTSTLYGESFSGGGFGPVVPHGYGIGYGYVEEQLGVLCSTYKSRKNGKQMVDAIEQSMKDIRNVTD